MGHHPIQLVFSKPTVFLFKGQAHAGNQPIWAQRWIGRELASAIRDQLIRKIQTRVPSLLVDDARARFDVPGTLNHDQYLGLHAGHCAQRGYRPVFSRSWAHGFPLLLRLDLHAKCMQVTDLERLFRI
ncbi:hypothetical protein CAL13_10875 [Bordetella genomosp. 9]|uniref:Uncharacterized protein n=1 Tax=Bordetella genomosp. 9 TaxID=1416803 RepID=A0A1W6Z0C8_9BORD|nr:hypothetical protein CAL13_10875 [Bordetella genomosp. 9]